jgi:hypothetical protein
MKNLLIIIFVKNKAWLLQRKAERGKIKYLIYYKGRGRFIKSPLYSLKFILLSRNLEKTRRRSWLNMVILVGPIWVDW